MTLFINACVRRDSRTRVLADELLKKWDEPVTEVCLNDISFPVTDEAFLTKRSALLAEGAFQDPMFDLARQFAEADRIVIAAPYWDLSFPAALKQYFEQINASNITFYYTPEGYPKSLCHAKQLFYVSTAGGYFLPEEYGFGYVKALAENFYGIPDIRLIMAKGLDIDGADVDKIMSECLDEIRKIEVSIQHPRSECCTDPS